MTANGVFEALSPTTPDPMSQSVLSTSISSLSSTISSKQSSHISKTYRQASTLFLTRRLPEALTTLLPLITPPSPSLQGEPAPVAKASRTTRIKVWSLYLTILNAILDLEPEEGKDSFGQQEWRALCGKVRDGQIWEEVVRNGYHGVEGDVDPDVVVNLATILLAQAPDQTLNQRRLEAFLASSNTPNLDLNGRVEQSPTPSSRMKRRLRSPAKGTSGANTPRDLNSRVKILELYTLHVLLRNNEWDYSREFISMSSILDEERRDAFLQALQSLQEDQEAQAQQEREERERQEDQLRREIEEAKRLRQENEEREKRRLDEERARREAKAPSEIDYGVDSTPPTSARRQSKAGSDHGRSVRSARSSTSNSNGKAVAPVTFTAKASMVVMRLRTVIDGLAASLNCHPAFIMRLLAFTMGLILMMGNKALRERVKRVLGTSWAKILATVGMGTKVSYI